MNLIKLKETIKTVVIAVLVAGILAFVGGIHYQSGIDHNLAAAKTAVVSPK